MTYPFKIERESAMPAPVRLINGPMVIKETGPDRRHTGREKTVLLVQVGQSPALREVELTEQQLIDMISESAGVLELIRKRRESGLPLPTSDKIVNSRDVGRIPGDL